MTSIHRLQAKGNLGSFALRPEVAPGQPAPPTLAEILGDPCFSDRAKRLAEYLDGRCKAEAKWAAWPKVATIASHLGWDATDHGARKRVERGFRELIAAGVLGRVRLGDLVEWFDSEGVARGLSWPRELPRNLRRSAVICVLGWRIPGTCPGLPILTACDIRVACQGLPKPPSCDTGVASRPIPEALGRDESVAYHATPVSHRAETKVSHPSYRNVRTSNGKQETTTDSSRTHAREENGETVRSSSSHPRESGGAGEGPTLPRRANPVATVSTACLGPGRPDAGPRALSPLKDLAPAALSSSPLPPSDSLAPALERVMERAQVSPAAIEDAPTVALHVELPADEQGEPPADPARVALIAKVEEVAPGLANREVQRAVHEAVPDMLKTAKLGGSSSPLDHVRMAIEKAAGNPRRRDSIESLARGILKNWAREGFPAINAPEPPGRCKPRADPAADIGAAVERRRAAIEEEAQAEAVLARWEALPEPEKDAIGAEVDREHPELAEMLAGLRKVARRDRCVEILGRREPSTGLPPVAPVRQAPPAPSAVVAEPRPAVPIRDRSAEPPAGPSSTTDGRRAFLDDLTLDQRSRFDGWAEGRRAATLQLFAEGLDRVILDETLRLLAAPRRPGGAP